MRIAGHSSDPRAAASNDLKPLAGTDTCELPHVVYVAGGKLEVVMDDGSRDVFAAGDVMMLLPGHDAWCVGDEPHVFIEFSAGTCDYNE